jgi:diadenosine tetraphosphate (Ap4A) HIT family hydrolase
MQASRHTSGEQDQTATMPDGPQPQYPKVALDIDGYVETVTTAADEGTCFICSIVAGERDDHLVVFRDDVCVAFLAKWPTLLGFTLVAPLEHRTDVVDAFSADEYVELQRRVYRVGRAVSEAVPTERLYLLSLGSHQAVSHVHWHIAPLPPGIPYLEQQYVALMHENGYLDIPDADLQTLAAKISALLA